MRFRKWLMKQQWRIVQIRGIWSLFYGVLMLAYAYYAVLPFFGQIEVFGPFVFAIFLLILYLMLGYLYDRIFILWAPSQEVIMERNPFQYVPSPKDHIFWFPFYATLFDISEGLAEKYGVDTTLIQEAREYFWQLQQLRPENSEDIDKAIKLRDEFLSKHPWIISKRTDELSFK